MTAEPEAPLDQVVQMMTARDCGSVVIVKRDDIVGIFTVHDALRALDDFMRRVVRCEP